MLAGSLLFVLGFSFVFVSFGALFGAVGDWLFDYQRQITVVLGVLVILLGLAFIGLVPVDAARLADPPGAGRRAGRGAAARRALRARLDAVHRADPRARSAPWRSRRPAPAAGPCSASSTASGSGLPFIVAALAYRRMLGTIGWVRRHQQWVTPLGGVMLVAVGVLLVTGGGTTSSAGCAPASSPASRRGSEVATSVTGRSASGPGAATAPPEPPQRPPGAPALTPVELARWTWRQLTSMRTALILLFLLALAAVPGSVVPQEAVDSVRASQWRQQHPTLAPIYEKLGLFHVYDSVWFSAIYILLMVSLVGCFLPRMRIYWRGVRARPPKAPRNLARLPEHASYETDESPEEVLERAHAVLRGSPLPHRPARGRPSPPSAATCARPATCSSTSRCWSCWWASPWAACGASRAA